VTDAQAANVEADKLGVPTDVVIWYTVDNDYTPTQVTPYFEGIRSVPGRPVGIYGGFVIVEWAASVGIEWRWMAGAWNYGKGVSKYAHLYQRDVNVASGTTKVDRNVWLAPFPVWQGDDMPTADEVADAVLKRVFKKQPGGKDDTSLQINAEWQGNEFAGLSRKLDELTAAVKALSAPPVATVDYAAIAKAVVDEDHRRSAD
jgi:hypothetical protein